MPDSQEAIFLYLNGTIGFQLGRKGFSGRIPRIGIQKNDRENAVTLIIPGYREKENDFTLPLALQTGLLELFETDTDTDTSIKIPVPPSDRKPGTRFIPEGRSPNLWYDMTIDPMDEFWTSLLTHGRKYEIRWAESGPEPWCHRGQPEGPKNDNFIRMPVRRLGGKLSLTVFDDTISPPQFTMSLTPTASVCHLSGEPPFAFVLEVTSHAEEVITVDLTGTALREHHGMQDIAKVIDEETGEEVDWPYGIGCWEQEGPEPFPSDEMFEEFVPGVSYRTTWSLDLYNSHTTKGGGLESLEKNKSYQAEINNINIPGAFRRWRKGMKAELLAGDDRDKKKRWSGEAEPILVDLSGPFTFMTV